MSNMLLYLFEENYGLATIITVASIISACGIVASYLITRTIYKTTLPTRQAQQWQANYEAEKVRADALAIQATELLAKQALLDKEHSLIALEFSQLAQLFAKKSIILETLTGEYANLAELADSGQLTDYLRSRQRPVTDEIHTTQPGANTRKGKERS